MVYGLFGNIVVMAMIDQNFDVNQSVSELLVGADHKVVIGEDVTLEVIKTLKGTATDRGDSTPVIASKDPSKPGTVIFRSHQLHKGIPQRFTAYSDLPASTYKYYSTSLLCKQEGYIKFDNSVTQKTSKGNLHDSIVTGIPDVLEAANTNDSVIALVTDNCVCSNSDNMIQLSHSGSNQNILANVANNCNGVTQHGLTVNGNYTFSGNQTHLDAPGTSMTIAGGNVIFSGRASLPPCSITIEKAASVTVNQTPATNRRAPIKVATGAGFTMNSAFVLESGCTLTLGERPAWMTD
jgi:hypothetical protein